MFKKIFIILGAWILLVNLTACRSDDEYEDIGPTPEELRAEFELFFDENKESIIETIATDGEDVRLELADGYEFLMTILLDDIHLTDENRTLYILTFELTFSQMADLFGGLAADIQEAAGVDRFRLAVTFVDVNGQIIARSNFDVGTNIPTDDYPYEEEEPEHDNEETEEEIEE